MNTDNPDAIKLTSLEGEALHHLRTMDQRARSEMLSILRCMARAHPLRNPRPELRLIKTTIGGNA